MAHEDDELDVFGVEDDDTETSETETAEVEDTTADDSADENTEQAEGTEQAESDEDKAAREKAEADAAAAQAAEKLAEFKAAAEATLDSEDRDVATGTLPVAMVSNIKGLYLNLPTPERKAAREWMQDTMQGLMLSGTEDPANFMKARTYLQLFNEIKDAKASKAAGAVTIKVDPTVAFVERVAALMLAANLVTVPSEVKDGWEAEVEKLVGSLEDDVVKYREYSAALASHTEKVAALKEGEEKPEAPAEPEVNPVVIAAYKVAQGRAVGGGRKAKAPSTGTATPRVRSGHQGNTAEHIKEAIKHFPVGTFVSVAELCKVVTSQYGGDKPAPSQGAIGAKLKKNLGLEDYVRPETQPKVGVTVLAHPA